MSEDEADLAILSLANEKRKFALSLGGRFGQDLQDAFERGIDREWWTLVDVSRIDASPVAMRIFRLTDAGMARLAALERRAA